MDNKTIVSIRKNKRDDIFLTSEDTSSGNFKVIGHQKYEVAQNTYVRIKKT